MYKKGSYFFTSESVTEGHPDKVCDQVSDAFLDAVYRDDPQARVAVETLVTTGLCLVAGEVTTSTYVDVQDTVRGVVKRIGYNNPAQGFDWESIAVLGAIHAQSPDIAQGVAQTSSHEQGAGDQGHMFGYACTDTPEFMPLPISLAHKLSMRLAEVRKNGRLPYLGPDGKSQVTVEFDDHHARRVEAVVIAAQHSEDVSEETVRHDIREHVITPVCGDLLDDNTKYHVNATGRFVFGGPAADAGLTGRKIIVDTYGGWARHGGGCFSGKDPSKVDRSAAYAARYIAKNVVAAGLANECEVQLGYAIGVAEPLGVYVNTSGTAKVPEEQLIGLIRKHFPLKPGAIIEQLDLRRPIYEKTAAYGHFGREDKDFTWEKLDKVEALQAETGVERAETAQSPVRR